MTASKLRRSAEAELSLRPPRSVPGAVHAAASQPSHRRSGGTSEKTSSAGRRSDRRWRARRRRLVEGTRPFVWSAPERVARRLKRWVRPEKNAARCEASCTESVKASSLRSSSATWSDPNIWVMPTEARVVTREPRNRMQSRVAAGRALLALAALSRRLLVRSSPVMPPTSTGSAFGFVVRVAHLTVDRVEPAGCRVRPGWPGAWCGFGAIVHGHVVGIGLVRVDEPLDGEAAPARRRDWRPPAIPTVRRSCSTRRELRSARVFGIGDGESAHRNTGIFESDLLQPGDFPDPDLDLDREERRVRRSSERPRARETRATNRSRAVATVRRPP